MLRKTNQDTGYFVPQGGCEKSTVNMMDSDHDMRDTVVHATGRWEAESVDERGALF